MIRPSIGLAMMLIACTPTGATSSEDGAQTVPAALPPHAVVLPAEAVQPMLRQCSRATPSPGESAWQPEAMDIVGFEAALPAALAERRRTAETPDWANDRNGWRRQYVGYVRDGRRFIYGNFYPRGVSDGEPGNERWHREPIVICDGGPAFFGAEYDVEAGRITHLDFNGSA